MQIVARAQQIQVLLLATFWLFFSPPNIFDPGLVESMDTQPMDLEDWLDIVNNRVWHIISTQ